MKKRLVFLFVPSMLLICSSLMAQEIVIDQMQPGLSTDMTWAIGGTSNQKLAQTVTVGLNGRLEGIFLPIGCSSGVLEMEIRNVNDNGTPGDVVLWRRRFPAVLISSAVSSFRFFPTALIVGGLNFRMGDRFAVVLANSTGACGIWQGPNGDSYAGGDGFFDARPNLPGWLAFSAFPSARQDLPFMTVMFAR